MAKGKGGKSKGAISAGKHSNVSSATKRLVRDGRSGADKMLNLQREHKRGKNPWVTIENPDREQTNKRFIRVKSNELWGNPKNTRSYCVPSLIVKGAD